jgi:hypothetical protein
MMTARARAAVVAPIVLAFIALACSPSASTTPSPTVAPTATATAAATASPTEAVTPVPTEEEPTATLRPEEEALVDQVRADAQVDCYRPAGDLPSNATVGVGCRINSGLVNEILILQFEPPANATTDPTVDWYFRRLSANGVQPKAGDCDAGTPGDRAWPGAMTDPDSDGVYVETRSGCFIGETQVATVVLTCYGPLFIEVLGSGTDIGALYDWVWMVAPGESADRDPPGLCARTD